MCHLRLPLMNIFIKTKAVFPNADYMHPTSFPFNSYYFSLILQLTSSACVAVLNCHIFFSFVVVVFVSVVFLCGGWSSAYVLRGGGYFSLPLINIFSRLLYASCGHSLSGSII